MFLRVIGLLILLALAGYGGYVYGLQRAERPGEFRSDVDWGKFLVNQGVCSDCHTPVDAEGRLDQSKFLSGVPAGTPPGLIGPPGNAGFVGPFGTVFPVNLTPDPETGLAAPRVNVRSAEDFINRIRTGTHLNPDRSRRPLLVMPFYLQLRDGDLRAIYAYLRTIAPVRNAVPEPAPPAPAP